MSTSDPKRDFAVEVVERLQAAGYRAFWAGGCVRDLLMGRSPQDYDVATDAVPETVRDLFGRRRTIAVGVSFGVVIIVGTKTAGNVEVATFRTEGAYLDGRRPETVAFSTPEEDATRRDFTINGIFYDPTSDTVHDYVGGRQDLANRVVRAIGNAHDRMSEDKLRLLRAVRFAATLEFELEPNTAAAVRAMASEIRVVSAERIAQELKKMLVDRHRRRAIELADDVALLTQIIPELASIANPVADGSPAWERTLNRLDHLKQPGFELAAAALFCDLPDAATAAKNICKRLRLSNQESDAIAWLLSRLDDVKTSKAKTSAQLKRLLVHPRAAELLELAQCDALAGDGDLSQVIHVQQFLACTPTEELSPPPLISGDDLIADGFEPGKDFRRILEAVRDAQLNGEISSREQALDLARRLKTSDE